MVFVNTLVLSTSTTHVSLSFGVPKRMKNLCTSWMNLATLGKILDVGSNILFRFQFELVEVCTLLCIYRLSLCPLMSRALDETVLQILLC